MKKLVCIILSIGLITVLSLSTLASENIDNNETNITQESIKTIAGWMAEWANSEISEQSRIELTDKYVSISETNLDGDIETKYIIGYEKTDEGFQIIDPSNMAKGLTTLSNFSQSVYYRNFWGTKVYLILTYNAIYTRYYNSSAQYNIYRPNGLTAYWTAGPDAPSITVSSMYVGYGSVGNLVQFPECNTVTDLSTVVVQSSYVHGIEINASSPITGQVYSAYNSPPINRAIWMTSFFEYGSFIIWDLYTSQGRFGDQVQLGIWY